MKTEWIAVVNQVPPEGIVVQTKIDDEQGCRNEQSLVRHGALWFFPSRREMYVYYTPTHWKPVENV